MDIVREERAPQGVDTRPDLSWRRLYQAGGIAAALNVLMIIVPLVLLTVAPQPSLAGGAAVLDYIGAHKAIYLIELVCFVGLSLPALIVFLALFVALVPVHKSYAAIGAHWGRLGDHRVGLQ
jgi:hypothetical protein